MFNISKVNVALLAVLFLISVSVYGITLNVPGNSDYVMYFNFEQLITDEVEGEFIDIVKIFDELGIPKILGIYGKNSLGGPGQLFKLALLLEEDFENFEDGFLDILSGLPLGLVLPGEIGDKTLISILSLLSNARLSITQFVKNTLYEVPVGTFGKLYVIRSNTNIYVCFNNYIAQSTKAMLDAKVHIYSVSTKDDYVFYYKALKFSPVGDLLYQFIDFYGTPSSEEAFLRKSGDEYHFELSVSKSYVEYERKLALSRIGALKGHYFVKDSPYTFGFRLDVLENVKQILMFGLLEEIAGDEERFVKALEGFLDSVESVFGSISEEGFLFSVKYIPEYEKDIRLILELLKRNGLSYKLLQDKKIALLSSQELDNSTELGVFTNDSHLYFRVNVQVDELGSYLEFTITTLQNGNTLVSCDFTNPMLLLEYLMEKAEESYEEEYEYYDYEEDWEEYEEEYDEYYEEEYDEFEEEYEEEWEDYSEEYEEEYYEETTEEVEWGEYSDVEYEIADELDKISYAVFDFLGYEGIQEVDLDTLYEYGYIDYIPENVEMKTLIFDEGYVFTIILYTFSDVDAYPENVQSILSDKGWTSDVWNNKLSLILVYYPNVAQ
ncbi:MAG: hypothetical protein WHS64_04755 [Fervidobacterium sp.]|uniref:Uncharacterized protein n=1 Tax=Fervidobacterium gondwanense DSM 13020 TaxID=1121883 RepID=A0A1M7TC55_FERGO|nr:hypothetical protein [Fervidobacterium gondwanense]SHN68273.1 hypothetical protein SAMN02745226_01816 [Fervidobacterium gondwanense DSM 13020]